MSVSAIAVVDLANELIVRNIISEQDLLCVSRRVSDDYQLFKQGQSIVERRLDEAHLLALWSKVDVQSDVAFHIGRTVNKQAKGLLANWISHSDSLSQAFDIFRKNIALLNHAENWQLSEQGDRVVLTFSFQSDLTYPDTAIERSMVAMVAWANDFVDHPLRVQSARFCYEKPNHVADYFSIFGDDLAFNSNTNALVLLKHDFHQALQSANPYLRDVLKARSQSISLETDQALSHGELVRRLLLKDLSLYSHVENTLKALHLSRATLYRKLKNQGLTFTELVFEARLNKLNSLNQVSISSEDTAHQLGFSDVSSYYRFVKQQSLKR